MRRHPNQPVIIDEQGVSRFQENKLVIWLVDQLPGGMNTIARQRFSDEDREQLVMLLGYSVSGAADLSCVSDECLIEAGLLQPSTKATESSE